MASSSQTSYEGPQYKAYIRIKLTHIDNTYTSIRELPSQQSSDRRLADKDERYAGIPYVFKHSPILGKDVPIAKVPVIRIFGATELGQRCCIHVHGTVPYVYIEYKGDVNPDKVHVYILRLASALNQVVGESFQRQPKSGHAQYVGYIALTKGIPFYGFHVGYRYFLKIMLLAPQHRKKICDALKGGKVMGTTFETFEAHINANQQFMTDYNLYGCGYIDLEHVKFRGDLPKAEDIHLMAPSSDTSDASASSSRIFYTEGTVPPRMRYPPGRSPARISPHSSLELDIHVSAILNRQQVTPRLLHHDFTEYLHNPYSPDQRLVSSVRELWVEEGKRRAEQTGDPPPRVEAIDRDRRYAPGEAPRWAQSDTFGAQFAKLAANDRLNYQAKHAGQEPSFETFSSDRDQGYLAYIPTTYESTTCTYPSIWEKQEIERNPFGIWAVQGIGIDVLRNSGSRHEHVPSPIPTVSTAGEVSDGEEGFEDEWRSVLAEEEAEERARDRRAGVDESDDDEEVDAEEHALRATTAAHAVADVAADPPPSSPEERGDPLTADGNPMLIDVPTSPVDPLLELDPTQMPKHGLGSLTDITFSDLGSSPGKSINGHSVFQTIKSPHKISPAKYSVFGHHSDRDARIQPGHTHGQGYKSLAKRSRQDQEIGWRRRGETTLEKMLGRAQTRAATAQAEQPVEAVTEVEADHETAPDASPDRDSSGENRVRFATTPLRQERSRDFEELFEPDMDEADEPPPSPTQLVTVAQEEGDDPLDPDEPPAKIRRLERTLSQKQQGFTSASLSLTSNDTASGTSTTVTPELPYAAQFGQLLEKQSKMKTASSSAVISSATDTSSVSLKSGSSYHGTRFQYHEPPPSALSLTQSIEQYGQRQKIWTNVHFSVPKEVPARAWEYASRSYRIGGSTLKWIDEFRREARPLVSGPQSRPRQIWTARWEYVATPPSRASVERWSSAQRTIKASELEKAIEADAHIQKPVLDTGAYPFFSQMEGPTQNHFKFTQMKQGSDAVEREPQHMAVLAMELQARARIHPDTGYPLQPDPKKDQIDAIFYCLQRESDGPFVCGYFAIRDVVMPDLASIRAKQVLPRLGVKCDTVYLAESELDLLNEFHDRFHEWDPEVVVGFEVQFASWGYLLERAEYYDMHFVRDLGRVTEQSTGRHQGKLDQWSFTHTSTIKMTGRHCLPIWRVLKGDVALTSYTFENMAFHVLQERTPYYSPHTLTKWMASRSPTLVARTLDYWLKRVAMDVRMIEEAEIVTRNAEFARIYGVDFESVLQRGSQFKVESFMFRIAKPESFVLLSPSRVEVGKQNAAECIPLIMEPRSAFYTSPVIVLDFQSLYPSVMIAYNMCYSTCLGRTIEFKGVWKLGITKLEHQDGTLTLLREHVNITPNGIIFLKPHIRRSLLAKMLTEILDTRVMVKASMKRYTDKALLKMMNARQLGLKFIANVTYGYTSATFSGRMPCVEIADAIVQTGRETLEKAQQVINHNERWGAHCVYGDTDSLFVELKGKTRDEAFRIGKEIADAITALNPFPVKLKFEKVYLGSVLAAKKRYVGWKFEDIRDKTPSFDAKGIETVRRDGFPAMSKMVEQSLKILFRTQDISEVKAYVTKQWQKLQMGLVSPQDYIFAKEVKLGTYS